MGGGLLQLVAYGAQDAYITGNPHITFWKTLYKRHTNFAMEAFRVNFTGSPVYGQRIVAVVNRNADLIWKTYVQVVLPDTTTGTNVVYWTGDAQRRLGYQLLKKIELEIGGQIIDTHYGEWLFLWENLTAPFDESVKLDSMVGGPLAGDLTTNNSCGGRPGVLYIPLQFWFNRNPGLALPLIALQYHEVRFNIYLNKATDLVSSTGFSNNISTAAAALPQIKDMALYIDYVYLDVDERRRFAQDSHEYLIDQLQTGIPQTITSANTRIDLTLNHPVKELVWVFQDARKLDCGSALSQTVGYTQPFTYDDIVDKCRLQINGQDRFDERYGDYFWKVQPYQHHSGGAFWPTRNATVSSVTATVTCSSGNATIQGSTLNITGGLSGGTITENMQVSGTFGSYTIPAGTYVVDYGNGAGGVGTYELSQAVSPANSAAVTSTTAVTFVAPNVQQNSFGAFNPINVYSFALKPEEHQPTGTCNFSRIDTATLVFDSITTNGAGSYPSKQYPFAFRIYAVNYNILRIMSGMGGLAYSN
jgi:Major capsid protein N-terminus/Large eukaryotic DNA virus major capsid protein